MAKIYPVQDLIESVVDPGTFLPLRYVQRLREGRHRRYDVVAFDHDREVAKWSSPLENRQEEIDIDGDTRDVLSLAYFMRSKGMQPGQEERFRVLVDDKLYDLHVGGRETVAVRVRGHGRVRCLEVEPKARFGEIFVRRGRMKLWFSLDPRHVCTRMSARVPLASVRACLISVEGPGDDVWTARDDEGDETGGRG